MSYNLADQSENLSSMARAKPFLGREFLTWLWHKIESGTENISVRTERGDSWSLGMWIDDRIVLESALGTGHINTMKGGDPSRSPEAAVSLLSGKSVRELKIGLQIETLGEFSCVLSCEDLAPRGLHLPKPEMEDEGLDQKLERRLTLTCTFLEVLNGLFAMFLDERMSDNWDRVHVTVIKDWIQSRADKNSRAKLH